MVKPPVDVGIGAIGALAKPVVVSGAPTERSWVRPSAGALVRPSVGKQAFPGGATFVDAGIGAIDALAKPAVVDGPPTDGAWAMPPVGASVRPQAGAFDEAPKMGVFSTGCVPRVSSRLLVGHDEWLGHDEQGEIGGAVIRVERDVHSEDLESTESIRSNRTGMWGKGGTEIHNGCMCAVPLPCKRRLVINRPQVQRPNNGEGRSKWRSKV